MPVVSAAAAAAAHYRIDCVAQHATPRCSTRLPSPPHPDDAHALNPPRAPPRHLQLSCRQRLERAKRGLNFTEALQPPLLLAAAVQRQDAFRPETMSVLRMRRRA